MLVKLEHKSARVKGLAFHPRRPWVLASLHTGAIELIDYSMETVIDKFEEHEGPVRGVDFHQTQPLFVSGGDDYKIKVWNYQTRRCLFTLLGHLDYIRTVQFHHEYPWILSASDDQTIRIWNWQSRSSLSVLTGHNHYVMCAQFHPKDDLIVSASLDQTVRVWDISGLRKKNVTISAIPDPAMRQGQATTDLFGANDVVVKYVLEGHSRGVNWATFHKKMPLIVSGADDREVKIWRMSESKAWEIDTMRGHVNNVSCVIFHPKKEYLISNSEDRSIRVWDISRQNSPQSFRRENDRYWIVAAHPNKNLLAAGHDNGMVVFKLDRERPPFDSQKQLFYLKDRFVRAHNFKTGQDAAMFSLSVSKSGQPETRSLIYNIMNPSEHNFLLTNDHEGGSYELYSIGKGRPGEDNSPVKGLGTSAVFVSRTRFAILDQTKQVQLKSFNNETKKRFPVPVPSVNYLFGAGIDRLLMRTPDKMLLYDLRSKKVVNEISIQSRHPVKYVVWSRDRKYVALMSKFYIYIANSKLQEICTISENARVKSGSWDSNGIFFYSTTTHVKYCLVSGDNGIVRTLEDVIYITSVEGSNVFYLDREGEAKTLTVDVTEALFKRALVTRNLDEVRKIVQSDALIGQSIIAYLQKKGYPDVALYFVQDEKTKFSLALQCGKLKVAKESAFILNDPECWEQLGQEALQQGDHSVVEVAYMKTKNFEKLAFLYLITGNITKLTRMLEIAQARKDIMGRFHTSLYLGNVEERVKVLKEAEQFSLAYMCAKIHNLTSELEDLSAILNESTPDDSFLKDAKLFSPPTPIFAGEDWPKLEIRKGYFDDAGAAPLVQEEEKVEEYQDEDDEGRPVTTQPASEADLSWGDASASINASTQKFAATSEPGMDAKEDFGWGGEDLGFNLPSTLVSNTESKASAVTDDSYFIMPTLGASSSQKWIEQSKAVLNLVAAGAFDLAIQQLNRSLGMVNFSPLKQHFLSIHLAAHFASPSLPNSVPLHYGLTAASGSPIGCFSIGKCAEHLKQAYAGFSSGKDLAGAMEMFRDIFSIIPLLSFDKAELVKEAQELLDICREYVTAARIELARRDEADPVKKARLAGLFANCNLQPIHSFIGFQVAIKSSMAVKNFKTAGIFCRKFLELSQMHRLPRHIESLVPQVREVLIICEREDSDATPSGFDSRSSSSICAGSFSSLSFGDASVSCSLCKSTYIPKFKKELCATCQLCSVGATVDGSFLQI